MNALPTDIQRYCIYMEEVKSRLAVIEVELNKPNSHAVDLYSEILAIQFRKVLEAIAFGSLIANRGKYSLAYANYSNHWNAKILLENLETINPNFYPIPLKPPILRHDGSKHFDLVKKGYLTKEQFVSLYTDCGSILHTHNPYKLRKPKQISPDAAKKWVKLIRGLLNIHLARLVEAVEGWAVVMQDQRDNKVHAFQFQELDNAPCHESQPN